MYWFKLNFWRRNRCDDQNYLSDIHGGMVSGLCEPEMCMSPCFVMVEVIVPSTAVTKRVVSAGIDH